MSAAPTSTTASTKAAAGAPAAAAGKRDEARSAQVRRLRYRLTQWPGNLIAGQDPKMRQARAMTFIVGCLYLAWLAVIREVAIPGALVPPWLGELLWQQLAIAALAFYPLVRSGATRRWSDRALVVPQMLWGNALAIMTYACAPSLRNVALQTLCLVQVFGFMSLKPAAARWMGVGAIGMLLGMLGLMARRHSPDFDLQAQWLPIGTSCGVIGVLTWQSGQFADLRQRVSRKRHALSAAMESAKQISLHDTLTGLPNRQFVQERIEAELKRAARTGSRFSVALLDLDHFKQVNDTHGHHVGDEVLITFAKTAAKSMRESDLIGRWGGEEFVVLMFDTDPAPLGMAALERIRSVLTRTTASKQAPSLRVRFSAGLTSSRPGETLEQMMERADKALYEAKSGGRNRTCVDT